MTRLAIACTFVLVSGCGAAEAPTPRIEYVFVTPEPTPTNAPTNTPSVEPTPSVVGPWFDAACEASMYLRYAVNSYVEAADRISDGDEEDVLDWVLHSRGSLDSAQQVASEIPDWEQGGRYASGLRAIISRLDDELARLELDPLEPPAVEAFNAITSDFAFLVLDSPGVFLPGCRLQHVVP